MQTHTIGRLIACIALVAVVALTGCGDKKADEGDGAKAASYQRPGFKVFEEDGRLWVFREGSEALKTYEEKGEPAKSVTRIGVGPERKTVRSSDTETIDAYLRAVR